MVGLWKTNPRFSQAVKLYLCLCISDLLIWIMNIPASIVFMVTDATCLFIAVHNVLGNFPVTFGLFTMLSIVIDRYLLTTKQDFIINI